MEHHSLLDVIWLALCAALVFLMQAGFMCLESGLTRSKNSINVAAKNITDLGISVFLFWAFGFALMFGESAGGWIGSSYFLTPVGQGAAWLGAFFLFQAMFCGTATTIFSGAVAERMRFSGYVVVAIFLSSFIYPIFGHWVWGGNLTGTPGWLEEKGFVDFAGSTVVHSVGGWVGLAMVFILGPRKGRFSRNGKPQKIQGHNLVMAILGVLLLWFGWFGFNGGSTLAMNASVPGILANTMLAAVAGLVASLIASWVFQGRPEVEKIMNGALAGLVAVTAGCHAIDSTAAVIVGGIGALVMLTLEWLLIRFRIDDVVGAFPVHAGAGIWGTIAVGFFADLNVIDTGLTRGQQIGVQCLGVLCCFLWAFCFVSVLLRLLNRVYPFRVTAEVEHIGLNISEHGATTEILSLFHAMDRQAKSGDMSIRVPVEPFTEVGQIADRYNIVMGKLDESTQELKTTHSRMKRDLESAAVVQKALLPQKIPDVRTARFAWQYRPCDELAGDILNIFQLDKKHVGLYVADVSGHGVAAALLSVAVSRTLNPQPSLSSLLVQPGDGTSPMRIVPPREVAQELNRRFPMDESAGRYFTLLYGVLDIESNEFRYISAGHPPVIRWSAAEAPSVVELADMAIGWVEDMEFEEKKIQLQKGDRLCIYTDGIPEAMDAELKQFGNSQFLEIIDRNRTNSLEQILGDLMTKIEQWCQPNGPKDDVTILAVEIL